MVFLFSLTLKDIRMRVLKTTKGFGGKTDREMSQINSVIAVSRLNKKLESTPEHIKKVILINSINAVKG